MSELTGSYLSFDGEHSYLSQWYKGEIHQIADSGKILRTINVGAEICGHTSAREKLYVLRGKENKDEPGKSEEWRIARLDVREATPQPEGFGDRPVRRALPHLRGGELLVQPPRRKRDRFILDSFLVPSGRRSCKRWPSPISLPAVSGSVSYTRRHPL